MQITRPEQLSTLIKAYRKQHGVTSAGRSPGGDDF